MPAPTTQFLQAGRPSCHARDLVIGEVGGLNPPTVFSTPPALSTKFVWGSTPTLPAL